MPRTKDSPALRSVVRFGAFEMNFEAGELRKAGIPVSLQDQPFRLLCVLLERPGQVVTREELRTKIWPADTFVDFDASLNIAVMKVRQALGDSASQPEFVQTVPRRGYRFLGTVEVVAPTSTMVAQSDDRRPIHENLRRVGWALILIPIMIGVLGIGAFLYLRSRPTLNQTWTMRPLTTRRGVETSPSFSPNGKFIAFSRMATGDSNIFVMPSNGGDAVQITNSPVDEIAPRWSPDGRRIAFLSDGGRTKKIYIMSPAGGGVEFIADTNLPYLERFSDTWKSIGSTPWSPDSKYLLFSQLEGNGQISVWKINLETHQQTRVTMPSAGSDDLVAAWSPDGNSIAFARRGGERNAIWVASARGGEPHMLLGDRFNNDAPAWSADSKKIIFVTDRTGGHNLWDIEVASGRLRRLTFGSGEDIDAIASPHGGVAYSHFWNSEELRILDLKTKADEQLTADTARSYRARFSPDGNQIAWDSNRTGNFDIWLVDLRTGKQRNLTNHPGEDIAPDWSPDGKKIAFLSDRNDKAFELWTIDIDDGTCRRMCSTAVPGTGAMMNGAGAYIRWSPDGRTIGFLAGTDAQSVLWAVEANGGNPRQLIRGVLAFDWFHDSRHIVYTRLAPDGSGQRELVLNDMAASHEQVLYRGPHTDLAAAADGSELLFVTGQSHYRQNLFLLPVLRMEGTPMAIERTRQLTEGNGIWHAHNGSFSPDRKRVVYTRDDTEADIYIIDGYR